MNIIVPINNGRTIIPVYIPTSTSHQTQLNESTDTNQTVEIDPIVGWSIVGIVTVLIIFTLIYFGRMMKDL